MEDAQLGDQIPIEDWIEIKAEGDDLVVRCPFGALQTFRLDEIVMIGALHWIEDAETLAPEHRCCHLIVLPDRYGMVSELGKHGYEFIKEINARWNANMDWMHGWPALPEGLRGMRMSFGPRTGAISDSMIGAAFRSRVRSDGSRD